MQTDSSEAAGRVVVLGTFDSKGEEHAHLRGLLRQATRAPLHKSDFPQKYLKLISKMRNISQVILFVLVCRWVLNISWLL